MHRWLGLRVRTSIGRAYSPLSSCWTVPQGFALGWYMPGLRPSSNGNGNGSSNGNGNGSSSSNGNGSSSNSNSNSNSHGNGHSHGHSTSTSNSDSRAAYDALRSVFSGRGWLRSRGPRAGLACIRFRGGRRWTGGLPRRTRRLYPWRRPGSHVAGGYRGSRRAPRV